MLALLKSKDKLRTARRKTIKYCRNRNICKV